MVVLIFIDHITNTRYLAKCFIFISACEFSESYADIIISFNKTFIECSFCLALRFQHRQVRPISCPQELVGSVLKKLNVKCVWNIQVKYLAIQKQSEETEESSQVQENVVGRNKRRDFRKVEMVYIVQHVGSLRGPENWVTRKLVRILLSTHSIRRSTGRISGKKGKAIKHQLAQDLGD
jgi:hypothetical protein